MQTDKFKAYLEDQLKQLCEEQDILLKYLGSIILVQEEMGKILNRLEEIQVQLSVLHKELSGI